jgi:hypothetical protein
MGAPRDALARVSGGRVEMDYRLAFGRAETTSFGVQLFWSDFVGAADGS